jgi:hypothetical protein
MVSNGLMTEEVKRSYTTNPTVEEALKKPNMLGSFIELGNVALNKSVNTAKIDNRTALEKHIDEEFGFTDEKNITESPKLDTLINKMLNCISKICTSCGISSLARSCRSAMSLDGQSQLSGIETKMAKISDLFFEQEKAAGGKIDSNKNVVEDNKSKPIQKAFKKKQGLDR